MGKIYRRDNLVKNVAPKKKDEKARKRNCCVNFRVTPEEKDVIFNRIRLSGMLVQEYVAQSCMHNKVTAIGNVKTFDAIREEMKTIDRHLLSVQRADELEWEVWNPSERFWRYWTDFITRKEIRKMENNKITEYQFEEAFLDAFGE